MTEDEIFKKFGVTESQLDEWEEDASKGVFHGNVREIVVGRPKLSNESLRAITVTLPTSMVDSIDTKNKNRSAFIRDTVSACL